MSDFKRALFRTGIVLGLVAGCSLVGVLACCGVGPKGKPIAFGDQTNIVIWNPATQTEHFIRDAKFRSDAPDFGFIAPSPSKPDLSEASIEAFDVLDALQPRLATGAGAKADEATASLDDTKSVRVIQERDVSGYHATTLLASNAGDLATWMLRNGYQTTPSVEAWTKVYIAKGWYLTAFKVIDKARITSTGTIRMSFKTDKPFNPYFVPSDNIKKGQKGTLKVYFVAPGNYRATVGSSTLWQTASWHAPVPVETSTHIAELLKLAPSEVPAESQVQAYVDRDFPRTATDDIYFAPASNHHLGTWVVGAVFGGAFAVLLIRRLCKPA